MGENGRGSGTAAEAAHLTPERAALAAWALSGLSAEVVAITARGDRAEVVVRTEPDSHDSVYCVRDDTGWRSVVSGTGPTSTPHEPDDFPGRG